MAKLKILIMVMPKLCTIVGPGKGVPGSAVVRADRAQEGQGDAYADRGKRTLFEEGT